MAGLPDYFFWDKPARIALPVPRPPVGSRVRYTGVFLRNTGMMTGSAGQAVFEVLSCDCTLCQQGEHVRINDDRHIHIGNVVELGRLDVRNCP